MRTFLVGTLLVVFGAVAFAHGDKVHVLGTITNVSDFSIAVKSADGKTVEVKLVKTTTYILRVKDTDQPAKAADLAVGEMVVIHATPIGDTLQADEVKFSIPAKNAPQKVPGPKLSV